MSNSSVALDEVSKGSFVDDLLSIPASSWDRRIAADLIAEMEIHLADRVATIPQMRRILAVKGYQGYDDESRVTSRARVDSLRSARWLMLCAISR